MINNSEDKVLEGLIGGRKNIDEGFFSDHFIYEDFSILILKNQSSQTKRFQHNINSNFIQFHFGLKGTSKFMFNAGNYGMGLDAEKSLLLYNPQQDLPMDVYLEPDTQVVSMLISIKKFHSLFSQEADYIPFLSEENKDKKYYKNDPVIPAMVIILNQMLNFSMNNSVKKLYYEGKCYELLSLYFNTGESNGVEQCPFLANEADVIKLKNAKNIIIQRVTEPPSLPELAAEVGLSLKKLKEGFRQVYGNSVYGFLFDYKMEMSRKMLESQHFNVNEVGLKIGYSTASHFIAAFKKKFGVTPKKYLQSL